MKSNELMLGDIILKDGQPGRVIELYGGEVADCYAPVFITPEILDANGISIDDDDWFVWEKRSGAYTLAEVKMYQDDDVWRASIFGPNVCQIDDLNIRFVHELQHALRLAGLADLADNFKIMKGCQ